MATYNHEEDPIIRSQQFVCLSFLNPTTKFQELCEQNVFKFLKYVTKNDQLEDTTEEYRNYLNDYYTNLSELQDTYPGLKVRGVYKTYEEATARVNKLSKTFQDSEPVHIYIAEVGKWVPFLSEGVREDQGNYTMYQYLESLEENRINFENRMNDVRKTENFSKRPQELVDGDAPEHKDAQQEPLVYTKTPYDATKDYLLEDQVIPEQRYACVSFNGNPTEFSKKLVEDGTKRFIYSYLHEYQQDTRDMNELHGCFTDYVYTNRSYNTPEEQLIPMLKIRGVQMTEEEANERSKLLQLQDPSTDVLVANLGFWLPFAPRGEIETKYSNTHLNAVNEKFKAARMYTEMGKAKMRELKFDPKDMTTDITNDTVNLRKETEPTLMEVLNMDEDVTEL